MEFKGSKTYENVYNSCKGEISGVILYELLSEKAEKEGLLETAELFKILSGQEKSHAEIFQKFLVEVGENCELSKEEIDNLSNMLVGDVKTNIQNFAMGEIKAGEEIYPEYAKIASEEGFDKIAKMYLTLAPVETGHGNRLKEKLEKLS